jgi:predicted alpha/beta-fold hydrolase
MRCLGCFVLGLVVLTTANLGVGKPQWLTLPPTPSLPKSGHSGYALVNRIRIWYAVFGHGAPVILLHGGLANSNYWGNQVPVLAQHYRVIVMDSRGHGRSERNDQHFSYDLMASDAVRANHPPSIDQAGSS